MSETEKIMVGRENAFFNDRVRSTESVCALMDQVSEILRTEAVHYRSASVEANEASVKTLATRTVADHFPKMVASIEQLSQAADGARDTMKITLEAIKDAQRATADLVSAQWNLPPLG